MLFVRDRPGDARRLVGQGHGDHQAGSPATQGGQSRIGLGSLGAQQHRVRAVGRGLAIAGAAVPGDNNL